MNGLTGWSTVHCPDCGIVADAEPLLVDEGLTVALTCRNHGPIALSALFDRRPAADPSGEPRTTHAS